MSLAKDLAALMAANKFSPEAQLAQTEFRLKLADAWNILPGAKVLEIGCGQGDMTAVLAHAVGASGRVVAVDIANPEYGAPVSIGDSAKFLKSGPLGQRIEFRFEFDALSEANPFEPNSFDFVVLAHCTWYFDSLDRLAKTLKVVQDWTPRVCLSEWDLEPRSIDQLGHLLAIVIQGQVEVYKSVSESNVRTPYSRQSLKDLLDNVGWLIASEELVETQNLADARWEIRACLEQSVNESEQLEMPDKARSLVKSLADVLKGVAGIQSPRPLPAYAIVAKRAASQ